MKASSQFAEASSRLRDGFSGPYLESLLAELDRASICRRIARARKEAGITQPELAELVEPKVHHRTVQNWETGERDKKTGQKRWPVPFDYLDQIARITGRTKEWLLHGEEAATPSRADVAWQVRVEELLEEVLAQVRAIRAEREADAARSEEG